MRRLIPLALVCAALAGATACAHVQAAAMPGPSPLDVPAPPPRVVVPPSEDVADPPAPPAPATPAPVTTARPSNAPTPARTPDKPPATTPPTAVPAPPEAQPPTLETTSDTASLESQTNALLANAQKDLNRVDVRALSADAQAQFHAAQQFLKQAQTALHEKNLTYARNMAEKAAALASQLPKTGTIRPTVP